MLINSWLWLILTSSYQTSLGRFDIRATYNDDTQTTQRLLINIRLDKESTVCVSVYDSLAEILHMRLEAGVVHLKVMVATNINPKFMGGRRFLNSTSGIHFYFDNDVIASQSLFEEYITFSTRL